MDSKDSNEQPATPTSDATLPEKDLSSKLDLLTSLVLTLSQKTTESLDQVAKLSERVALISNGSQPQNPQNHTHKRVKKNVKERERQESTDNGESTEVPLQCSVETTQAASPDESTLPKDTPKSTSSTSKKNFYHRKEPNISKSTNFDITNVQEEDFNAVIKLNVGGRLFCTTRSTLTSVPGSMFEALISGRHSVIRDSEGALFLDRDPDIFESVLTYLRDPRQLDLRFYSAYQQQRILCELDYFMIPFERVGRPLPQNISGHTITIDRDNQWNLKWVTRWPDSPGDPSNSSSSSGISVITSSSALLAHQQKVLDSVQPQLKFVEDLVYLNLRGRPLRAYDLWTGQCLKIIKDSYCDCFAVSKEQLVTYDADDQSLRLWNAVTCAGVAWIKADVPPTNITRMSFVNENLLVIGGEGNKCVTLNLQIPDQATTTTVLQGANLQQIETFSDSVVAVGSTNGNIILWNIKLNVLLGTLPTAQQRIRSIFVRGTSIYCIGPETIKVWECSSAGLKPACISTIYEEVTCVDAEGDLIVGITADKSRKSLLKVWSLSSSRLVHVMPIPVGESVHTVRIQGNKIATILEDGTVLTWTISLVY